MAKTTVATEKIVFSYNRTTNEYIGEYKCQKDPLHPGSFLMPANATEIAPPETTAQQKAVFENGEWGIKTDYRGQQVISLKTQDVLTITELGDLPDGTCLMTISDNEQKQIGYIASLDADGNLTWTEPEKTTEQKISLLTQELRESDWYVIRFHETGTTVPDEITARRAEIRIEISTLREENESV